MSDSSTIGQRFTQLIQQLGLSKNAFAVSLDKTATVIQHLVDERNKPGYDLICKVFEIYPNVSKDWLLLGNGPMMLSGTKAPDVAAVAPAVPPVAAKPIAAPTTPSFPAALFTVSAARPAATPALAPPPVEAELPAVPSIASSPALAAEPSSQPMPLPEAIQAASPPVPAPAPAVVEPNSVSLVTPQAAAPATSSDALAAALNAQYLQHQLALAEQRNQHLLAQQQLMQQMLDFLRRPI